jgi:hypothetical protein
MLTLFLLIGLFFGVVLDRMILIPQAHALSMRACRDGAR